jgi:hypothetical protein
MTRHQFFTKLKQQRQLLPLLLLVIYCIDAIISAIRGKVEMNGVTYDYSLTIKHYIAFAAISINFLTYFFLRPFYKYTQGLTVAVGLFNLMTFSTFETTQSLALNSLNVSFQPSAFLAGHLAYIINFKRVNAFAIDNLTSKHTSEESEKVKFAEGVEIFKRKYESYTIEALTEIMTANKYVPEAKEEARQLQRERQTKKI